MMMENSDINNDDEDSVVIISRNSWRNLAGFWLLGLCNNFAYVVMLSAAHDILQKENRENSTDIKNSTGSVSGDPVLSTNHTYLKCNPIGTGAILLADILPTLVVKLSSPLYIQHISYRTKVSLVIIFAIGSFLLVALGESIAVNILGVVCASLSAGLGEPTFLGLTSHFHKNSISAWSSGTGGAGVFGALAYAGLTSVGVSPRTTVLIMIVIPLLMAISYFIVLEKPDSVKSRQLQPPTLTESLLTGEEKNPYKPLSWRRKLQLTKPLLRFMIPLGLVYFAEYFINQGLHEVLYFDDVWLSPKEQYRWYQVDYQIGVFISRSSVNLIRINKIWALPALQFVNLGILLAQVFYRFIPNIWIVFAIILFEGLLGGGAYVNTFYKMSTDIKAEFREYSLAVASISDSTGVALAGLAAIPVHNRICNMNIRM